MPVIPDWSESIMLLIYQKNDKPYKYPAMFTSTDAIIVSKMDYVPLSDFDLKTFDTTVRGMNSKAKLFHISARTGEGMESWIEWLESITRNV